MGAFAYIKAASENWRTGRATSTYIGWKWSFPGLADWIWKHTEWIVLSVFVWHNVFAGFSFELWKIFETFIRRYMHLWWPFYLLACRAAFIGGWRKVNDYVVNANKILIAFLRTRGDVHCELPWRGINRITRFNIIFWEGMHFITLFRIKWYHNKWDWWAHFHYKWKIYFCCDSAFFKYT